MNEDDARELEAYANAGAQRNQPRGHALVQPTAAITPIGAQLVHVHRDEAVVRRKLTELAAMAGDDWFYRFPVRNRQTGQTSWIEGPSIKLANSVARIFGNCLTEVREVDVGDAWVFYARFTDVEGGFSMERSYRQRKSQETIKTKDAQRQLDQVYQIGQSKAIRNVIVNSLQEYADYAFEQAQGSLVNKIGKDLEGWKQRTLEGLARIPVEVKRVERVIGRTTRDWLAADIARIISMAKQVADGMATLDETFPQDVDVQPPDAKVKASPAPVATTSHTDEEDKAAAPTTGPGHVIPPDTPPGATTGPPTETRPANKAEYMALVRATCDAATDAATLRAWFTSPAQRTLRNRANMVSDDTVKAKEEVDKRCQELEVQQN